jgi:K+/H+ antiporter YhaU regulatory subunit KhtT
MPEEEDVAGFWFHLPPEAMNGKTLHELDIRRLTGATVVAIKRGDRVLSHPGGEFSLENDDEMYVAGTPDQIAKFEQEFHCKHMEIEPPLAAAMSDSLPEQLI